MRDHPFRVLLIVVAVMVLAGCTTATAGNPTAGERPGPTTAGGDQPPSREPDRHGAPRVANPLDATRFLADPCAAIPPAQRSELGLSGPGKADTTTAIGTAAPNCSWSDEQGGNVGFLKSNRNGLADLYRRQSFSPEAYWEETTVEGYPAVFHGTPDHRNKGFCVIAVGLNDALAINVIADGRPGSPVCDRAMRMATVAVKTIKEGA